MKYLVLKKFDCGDKDQNGSDKIYQAGEVYSGNQAEMLLAIGLIEPLKDSKQAKVEEPEAEVSDAPVKKSKKSKED